MEREKSNEIIAKCLRDLRTESGLSKAKIADRLYLDERTWAKWERGESCPSSCEMIRIYDEMGADMLRPILEMLYPSMYADIEQKSAHEARNAAVHWMSHVASDSMVQAFNFIAFGNHGSNIAPQLAEFVLLNHLPMDYRVAIVKQIITFYRLAESRGEIVCDDVPLPEMSILIDAIKKGQQAAAEHRNSYTTGGDKK